MINIVVVYSLVLKLIVSYHLSVLLVLFRLIAVHVNYIIYINIFFENYFIIIQVNITKMKPKVIKNKCYIKHGDKYLCKYCNKSYKENVTRMAIHIKKECTKVPKYTLDNFSSTNMSSFCK